MILPDVNVLVHAFRQDAAEHAKCRLWLESVVRGDMAYGMSPQALGAVVRIVTHPRIFVPPTPLEEALAFALGHKVEIRSLPRPRKDRVVSQKALRTAPATAGPRTAHSPGPR